MYVLVKFQLPILKTSEVTAVQSSSNRKINLYSKYRENKLQVLTKTDVTYKWSDVQTQNFTIVLTMNLGMDYWESWIAFGKENVGEFKPSP